MNDSALAFEAKNVVKHFDKVKALDGVSLKSEQGKIFGLLGPNGAGKTTLVRMLSTLLQPTKGSLNVLGVDVAAEPQRVRELIGLAGQFAAVDEFLTGRENLKMVASLYHLDKQVAKRRINDLLKELRLSDAADRTVKTYSGGMRRRLDVGASMVGEPKVLFLDEPTTGLDPRTRKELWEIIRGLVERGTSILLTTQYLEEADELADTIAVIDNGKVIVEGTSDQLKNKIGGDVIEFELAEGADSAKALAAVKGFAKQNPSVKEDGQTVSLPVTEGSRVLSQVVRALDTSHVPIEGLALHRPSLDDVFLAVTGSKAKSRVKKAKVKAGRR